MILVGYGNQMVSEYLPTLKFLGIEITCVCDVSEERRALALADGHSIVGTSDQLSKWNKSTPVIVAVPPGALPGVLDELLILGFSKILVEKPAALSLPQFNLVRDRILDSDSEVFVASKRRFEPTYTRLRSEIQSDNSFDRLSVRLHRSFRTDRLGWRADPESAGADVLFDLGYHAIDLVYWLLGERSVSEIEELEEECWAPYPSRLIRSRTVLSFGEYESRAEMDVDRVAPSPFEQVIVNYKDRQLIAQRHELYSIAKGGSIPDVVIHRINRTPATAAMMRDFCSDAPGKLARYQDHKFHMTILEMRTTYPGY